MTARGPFPPIEEQAKNVNMILRVLDQPFVRNFVLSWAEEHPRDTNGTSTGTAQFVTSITDAVTKILPRLKGEYTYQNVIERVLEDGYEFTARDRRTAIGRVMRKLCDQGLTEEVKKGRASAPSLYRNR
jgi:hypothetical protein